MLKICSIAGGLAIIVGTVAGLIEEPPTPPILDVPIEVVTTSDSDKCEWLGVCDGNA
jgi:hypothetical protein